MRVDSIIQQAMEFEQIAKEDKIFKLLRFIEGLQRTHPWLIIKTKEVKDWIRSEQYQAIINQYGVPFSEKTKKRRKRRKEKALKFCPKCGSPVEPTDKFCPNCGCKLK